MKMIYSYYELIGHDGRKMNAQDKQQFRNDALKKVEVCARESHLSQDRVKDGSESEFVKKYAKDLKHLSILRHEVLTVHFVFPRAINIEIFRHQLAQPSPTQESTRYVKYKETECISIENAMKIDPKVRHLSIHLKEAILAEWIEAMNDAEKHYKRMLELGATPQIARTVLNNALKAGIYLTANLEEWLYILKQRASKFADPLMQEIMVPLANELKEWFPEIYGDLEISGGSADV